MSAFVSQQELAWTDVRLTIRSHGVCASARCKHASDWYPKRQDCDGKYCPPDFLEHRRRLKQLAVEQQE